MNEKFVINNKDLASHLTALFIMCLENDTDGCDIEISTKKGNFMCHIEFSAVEPQESEVDDGECK